jgi:hypothetical protein
VSLKYLYAFLRRFRQKRLKNWHISLTIKQGTLSSEGTVEDSLVLPSKTMASA